MSEPRYLSDSTLENLGISTDEIIDAIESTVIGARAGQVAAAPKTATIMTDGRYLMATLSASDAAGVIAVKSVMVNDRNKARNLPGINGAIMLLDSETGLLKAVLDANWVTAVRTAGISLVAAKRLADPGSKAIGLIGTGVQAESHLRAFSDSFPLSSVLAVGRGQAGINRISSVALELGLTFEQSDPQYCLQNADIIVSSVTLDHSIAPFLDAQWLSNGAFAAITDVAIPWIPTGQSAFGRIYIDSLAQEQVMDNPMVERHLVTGELADLVVDDIRHDPSHPAAFMFRGMAVGDLAVAALAFQRATQ